MGHNDSKNNRMGATGQNEPRNFSKHPLRNKIENVKKGRRQRSFVEATFDQKLLETQSDISTKQLSPKRNPNIKVKDGIENGEDKHGTSWFSNFKHTRIDRMGSSPIVILHGGREQHKNKLQETRPKSIPKSMSPYCKIVLESMMQKHTIQT